MLRLGNKQYNQEQITGKPTLHLAKVPAIKFSLYAIMQLALGYGTRIDLAIENGSPWIAVLPKEEPNMQLVKLKDGSEEMQDVSNKTGRPVSQDGYIFSSGIYAGLQFFGSDFEITKDTMEADGLIWYKLQAYQKPEEAPAYEASTGKIDSAIITEANLTSKSNGKYKAIEA